MLELIICVGLFLFKLSWNILQVIFNFFFVWNYLAFYNFIFLLKMFNCIEKKIVVHKILLILFELCFMIKINLYLDLQLNI